MPSVLTIAKVSIGATIGAWILAWRARRHQAAEMAEIAQFESVIATISDEELSQFYESYQMLSALEANQQFRRKRDACLAEMERRSLR